MTDKPVKPSLKNATTAPVIYFDAAPALGQANGVASILISAMMLTPMSDGQVAAEHACIAHLRGASQAIRNLRDACDKAIEMLAKSGTEIDPSLSPADALERRLKAMQ